ncbi:MAG: IS3 family transposase [Bacteroidota bacterium]
MGARTGYFKKSLSHFQPQDRHLIYDLISQLKANYPVKKLCELFELSRSAYYAYCKQDLTQTTKDKIDLANELERLFYYHKRRYGSRRLCAALKDEGYEVGRYKVRSLMRARSLQAIQPKSFVPRTTIVDNARARSPNLLLEMANLPTAVNQVVVGDITYLASENGWLYLAVWMDLFSRYIVSWQFDQHMKADLVSTAFEKLIHNRRPPPKLIVHSDGGTQYKAGLLRQMIQRYGYRQSMTRRDNHYDNAFVESLFSRLKAELLEGQPIFRNKRHAQFEVFDYIEGYYNTERKHSSLNYLSPMEFERQANS